MVKKSKKSFVINLLILFFCFFQFFPSEVFAGKFYCIFYQNQSPYGSDKGVCGEQLYDDIVSDNLGLIAANQVSICYSYCMENNLQESASHESDKGHCEPINESEKDNKCVVPEPSPAPPTPTPAEEIRDPEVVSLENPLGSTLQDTDIRYILGRVIQKALGVLGSITLVVFIYGGFLWLTSAGNQERVKKGGQTMLWAAVGIFIIFASYAILSMLIKGITG